MIYILFALHLFVQQPQCTDFSGTYVIQGEDGRVAVEIQQTACARISISWESSLYPNTPTVVHALALGGSFQSDQGWFGQKGMQRTAANLLSNRLELFQSPLSDSRGAQRSLLLRLDRLQDGDLCVSDSRTNSISPAMRASRLHSAGKNGQDEAARRSSEGCRVP